MKVVYGDELIVLAAGDSLYLDASLPHAIFPGGGGKARILSVSFKPDRNGHSSAEGRGTRSRSAGKASSTATSKRKS